MLMEVCFYFLSNNLVVSYQYFFFPLALQGLMRPYKQVCIIHCLQTTGDAQLTRDVDPITA